MYSIFVAVAPKAAPVVAQAVAVTPQNMAVASQSAALAVHKRPLSSAPSAPGKRRGVQVQRPSDYSILKDECELVASCSIYCSLVFADCVNMDFQVGSEQHVQWLECLEAGALGQVAEELEPWTDALEFKFVAALKEVMSG